MNMYIIAMIVILNLLWSGFFETNATFRSASTDLGHASVGADRNVAFVSKNPLPSKFKITIIFILGAVNNIFHT